MADAKGDDVSESTHEEVQPDVHCSIQASENGPYLVEGEVDLVNWFGGKLPARDGMALCRCGGSANKPFCDGTHARNGFTGAKHPKRVPDQRDTYRGQQVTVFDNRGICQHSGYCTDRLPGVFRTDAEPFVAPSGGRMDEIIRAVRDCPSGALSYALGGHEARGYVDWDHARGPAIEVTVCAAPAPWSWSSEKTTVSPSFTRATSGSKNRGAVSPTSTTTVREETHSGAPAIAPQSTRAKLTVSQFIRSGPALCGCRWPEPMVGDGSLARLPLVPHPVKQT